MQSSVSDMGSFCHSARLRAPILLYLRMFCDAAMGLRMKTSLATFGNAKSTRRRVPRWAVLMMNNSQATIFMANGTGSQIH